MHHISIGCPKTEFMIWQENLSKTLGYKTHFAPHNWPRYRIWTIDKFKLTKAYLESGYVSSEEIILFTDAYDACVIDPPAVLKDKFDRMNTEILVNAESNQFPDNLLIKQSYDNIAPEKDWPIKYLNSGCYMGYAYAINEMLSFILTDLDDDTQLHAHATDQFLMQKFYLDHFNNFGISGKQKIRLDYDCEIFYCAISLGSDNTKVELSSNKKLSIENTINGKTSLPSVLHANGPKMFCDLIRVLGSCAVTSNGSNTRVYQLVDENLSPVTIEDRETNTGICLKRVNRKQKLRSGSVFLLVRLPFCCFWSLDYGLLEFGKNQKIFSQHFGDFTRPSCLKYNYDLSLLESNNVFIKDYFNADELRLNHIEINRFVAKESYNVLEKIIDSTCLPF